MAGLRSPGPRLRPERIVTIPHRLRRLRQDPGMLSVVMLACLLLILCVAGGASRADVLGQVVVRAFAVIFLLILCLSRRTWSVAGIGLPLTLVAAMAAITVVQLIPLPPALWTLLPGRAPFEAAVPIGPQPWRPINLTPDGGLNALFSLTVPLAALAILAGVAQNDRRLVANLLLTAIGLTALAGSLQLGGVALDNPLINRNVGEASGIFANRNHQALLLACGLPLLCAWGLGDTRAGVRPGRLAAAAGLAVWFLFLILVTGSRAGLLLGAMGLLAAAALAWQRMRQIWTRRRRWALPALFLMAALVIAALVALVAVNDRALSLQRLVATADARDLRASSLPLLWDLIVRYFPFGSGLGSFDPVFRMIEPTDLLSTTYLNHAHNDVVELLIEAGAAGVVAIGLALFAWVRLGLSSWRDARAGGTIGPAMWCALSLILVASLVDYPLRTPFMMTFAVVAAWLMRGRGG